MNQDDFLHKSKNIEEDLETYRHWHEQSKLFSEEWQEINAELATLKESLKQETEERKKLQETNNYITQQLEGYQGVQAKCPHSKVSPFNSKKVSMIVGQRTSEQDRNFQGAVFVCQICNKSWYVEPSLLKSSFEMEEFKDVWYEFFRPQMDAIKSTNSNLHWKVSDLERQVKFLNKELNSFCKVSNDLNQVVYTESFWTVFGLKRRLQKTLAILEEEMLKEEEEE